MRKLGSAEIEVSEICLGCWALAGGFNWGPQERSQSIKTIHAALDEGICFFDTAPMYGDGLSEEIVGEALRGRRDGVVIATKVNPQDLAPDAVVRSCEESLTRLRTDAIDLLQIHWPSREVPVSDTVAAFVRLRESGKIRAVGISNFGPQDLHDFLEAGGAAVTNQLPYSLLWRAIEFEIQPLCLSRGIGILPYSPLLQGLLTGKFRSADEVPADRARTRHFSSQRPQASHSEPGAEVETFDALAHIEQACDAHGLPLDLASLAWLLRRPAVTSVIVGARSPDQIRHNARAASLALPDSLTDQLSTHTQPLKDKLGPNPDLWRSESRYR